jgi:hypothetical protein
MNPACFRNINVCELPLRSPSIIRNVQQFPLRRGQGDVIFFSFIIRIYNFWFIKILTSPFTPFKGGLILRFRKIMTLIQPLIPIIYK